jgi:TrwC relaxase
MWRGVGPGGEVLRRGAKYASPGADELQQREDQAVSDARALNPLLTEGEAAKIRSRVRARVRHSVIAWDHTESGVKSLTMTWAGLLAKAKQEAAAAGAGAERKWQQRANEITDVLHETVDETIAWFERTALFTRTGHHGNAGDGAYRDGRGVAGAKFLQHTNRNGDPPTTRGYPTPLAVLVTTSEPSRRRTHRSATSAFTRSPDRYNSGQMRSRCAGRRRTLRLGGSRSACGGACPVRREPAAAPRLAPLWCCSGQTSCKRIPQVCRSFSPHRLWRPQPRRKIRLFPTP